MANKKNSQHYGNAKEANYSWEAMLERYSSFVKEMGRTPKAGRSEVETKLYRWMYAQHRCIIMGTLGAEHYEMLKEAGFADDTIFKRQRSAVMRRYKRLKEAGYSEEANEYFHRTALGSVLKEPKAAKEKKVSKWEQKLIEYMSFIKVNHREPYSARYTGDENEVILHHWITGQRRNAKIGKLKSDRIAVLQKLNVLTPSLPDKPIVLTKWEKTLEDYILFTKENLREPYGEFYTTDEREIFLHNWIYRQRYNAKIGELRPDKLAKLQEKNVLAISLSLRPSRPVRNVADYVDISNTPIIINEESEKRKRASGKRLSYKEHIDEYMNFKKTHGRNPSSTIPEERSLYNWMYNETKKIREDTISDEHYNMLKEAGVDIPNRGNIAERLIKEKIVAEGDFVFSADCDLPTHMQTYIARVNAVKACFPKDRNDKMYGWVQTQFYNDGERLKDWQRSVWEIAGIEIKSLTVRSYAEKSVFVMTENQMIHWSDRYNEYRAFLEKYGRAPRQKNNIDAAERSLYFWKRSEIKSVRVGKRTPEQIEYLSKLNIAA